MINLKLIFVGVKNKKIWGEAEKLIFLVHTVFKQFSTTSHNLRHVHTSGVQLITLNDVTSVTKATCKAGYFMGVLHAMGSEESMRDGARVLWIISENFNCHFLTPKCVQFYTVGGRVYSDH
jgi:hypothetical protein